MVGARGGDVLVERVRQRAASEEQSVDLFEDLGDHFMCPESFARIQDSGTLSIGFNELRLTFLGPECP